MNKILLLHVFLFLSAEFLQAQIPISPSPFTSFEKMYSNNGYELGESIRTSILTSKEELLYSVSFNSYFSNYPSNLNFLNDVLHGNTFVLKKRNKNLDIVAEISGNDFIIPNFNAKSILGIFENEFGFDVFGFGHINNNLDSAQYFISNLDSNLILLSSTLLRPPVDSLSHVFNVKKNRYGNYLLLGFPKSPDIFGYNKASRIFVEMTPSGNVVHSINGLASQFSWSDNYLGYSILSNGSYAVLPNFIIDSNFVVKMLPNLSMEFSETVEEGMNSEIAFSGTSFFTNSGKLFFTELVASIDTAGDVDTLYYDIFESISSNDDTTPGFRNFSIENPERMYCAFGLGGYNLLENNFVHLSSFNKDLGILWTYYYGGDAYYKPVDTYTLSDGALFTFLKHYTEGNKRLSDIVYVKYNLNGEVTEISEYFREQNSAQLYPNPVSNTLHIDCGPQLNNPSLKLFDSFGRLVRNEPLRARQSQLDMSDLAGGVYVYQIWTEGKIVQVGKVVHL